MTFTWAVLWAQFCANANADRVSTIALQGELLFTGSSTGVVQIFDTENAADPTLLAELDVGSSTSFIEVQEDTLCVGSSGAGLDLFDVSDPASPEKLGNLDAIFRALELQGDLAFGVDATGLKVVRLADPSAPALVSELATPGSALDIDLDGDRNLAFIADDSGGLITVDIADPSAPVQLSQFAGYVETPRARNVIVDQGIAYLWDWRARVLQLVDTTDPANPLPGFSFENRSANFLMAREGNHLFFGRYDGVNVVEASGGGEVSDVGSYHHYHSNGFASGIAISGTTGYVGSVDGLEILDLSDLGSPRRIGPGITAPEPWQALPNLPRRPSNTSIVSVGESEFVVAGTRRSNPGLWNLNVDPVTGAEQYIELPFAPASTWSCFGGNFSGFTGLKSGFFDGEHRVLAGSGRTVSIIDIDDPEDVLQILTNWCWDPSSLGRIVGSTVGITIANFGARSGKNGLDVLGGEFVRLGGVAHSPVTGVNIFTSEETGEVVAVVDRRGLAWTGDLTTLLGQSEYSVDAGQTWQRYGQDRDGRDLEFRSTGDVELLDDGTLVGCAQQELYIGKVGHPLDRVATPAVAGVHGIEVDLPFARVFAHGSGVMYYADTDELLAFVLAGKTARLKLDRQAGGYSLKLEGEGAALFTVQVSTDLVAWRDLTDLVPLGWEMAIDPADHEQEAFFRAVQVLGGP